MTHDPDQRIADLLREDLGQDAPPERDPMFRVRLLERLERARHGRRLGVLIACGVVFAALAAIGAGVGGATREAAGALLIGLALTVVYFVVAPTLSQMLSRFR